MMKPVFRIALLAFGFCTLLFVFLTSSIADSQPFCGDIDGNGVGPDVSDVTYLVAFLFIGGDPPPNPTNADIDGVAGININDLTYLVSFIFRGGLEPICTCTNQEIFGGGV